MFIKPVAVINAASLEKYFLYLMLFSFKKKKKKKTTTTTTTKTPINIYTSLFPVTFRFMFWEKNVICYFTSIQWRSHVPKFLIFFLLKYKYILLIFKVGNFVTCIKHTLE